MSEIKNKENINKKSICSLIDNTVGICYQISTCPWKTFANWYDKKQIVS